MHLEKYGAVADDEHRQTIAKGSSGSVTSQNCWGSSVSEASSDLSPLLLSPRDSADWDQYGTTLQYTCFPYPPTPTATNRSDSETADAIPTWCTLYGDHTEEPVNSDNANKLPSMGTAFARSFYPVGNAATIGYANYIVNGSQLYDGQQQQINAVNGTDEFDLSLIRVDPTSLLGGNGSPPCPTPYIDDLQEELDPFAGFNNSCYAVGHLVSSPVTHLSHGSSTSTSSFYQNRGHVAGNGNTTTTCFLDDSILDSNQVVLPQDEGLLLATDHDCTFDSSISPTITDNIKLEAPSIGTFN